MRVSVIVCVYNQELWLPRCLRSILTSKEMADNYEIIVVDDSSTDASFNEALKFSDVFNNVRVVKNTKNLGLPASINVALERAIGQYFVRVDSDDFIDARLLTYLSTYLDCNPHLDAVSSDYYKVNESEEKISRHFATLEEIACGVMYRSEKVRSIGGYSNNFRMREGHELRKRFLASGNKIGHLELPFYYYRQHDQNRTLTQKLQLEKYDKRLNEN